MAQLIVRKVEKSVLRALKIRAAQKGRSAEAEHREILREVLQPGKARRDLKEMLLSMPRGGSDSDFRRSRSRARRVRL